jgi:hypothetical protein
VVVNRRGMRYVRSAGGGGGGLGYKPGVLNLVLASTMVLFLYRILLFDVFIHCGSSSKHFMSVVAGEM